MMLASLPSLLGFVVNLLVLGSYDDKTIRAIEVCDGAIVEKLGSELGKVTTALESELERLTKLAIKRPVSLRIEDLEVRAVSYVPDKGTLRYVRRADDLARKLSLSLFVLTTLRWLFVLLVTVVLLLSVLVLFSRFPIHFETLFTVSVWLSVFFLLVVLITFVFLKNTITKVGKEYGLSI